MKYERQKRLVERLLERTRAGELPWQESVSSNTFQVSFPMNSVQIRSIDQNYSDFYQILVVNSNGQTTDVFDNSDLEKDGPHLSGSWYAVLEELFFSARRLALKSDEVIDSILTEIG